MNLISLFFASQQKKLPACPTEHIISKQGQITILPSLQLGGIPAIPVGHMGGIVVGGLTELVQRSSVQAQRPFIHSQPLQSIFFVSPSLQIGLPVKTVIKMSREADSLLFKCELTTL